MRTAVITGSSRNIGANLALSFSEAGYSVVLVARNERSCQSVVSTIQSAGRCACAISADLSQYDAAKSVIDSAADVFGSVDILINNAVHRVNKPILETSDDDLEMCLSVTIGGAYRLCRAAIVGMLDRGWGRVINITGVHASGQRAAKNSTAHTAAKCALAGFTKALALEVAEMGITVNNVSPGLINTNRGPWTAVGMNPELMSMYSDMTARVPMKRMGKPSEIGPICLFLCSDEASYITGQTIHVDGGLAL